MANKLPDLPEYENEIKQEVNLVVEEVKNEVSRWPALLALLLIGGFNLLLSQRLIIWANWLLLPFLAGLVGLDIAIRLFSNNYKLSHQLLLLACGIITLSQITSLSLLVTALPDKTVEATTLLRDAGILWICNVVIFALWYWQVDSAGPYQRTHKPNQKYHEEAELLFPQLTLLNDRPHLKSWRPAFVDYLFVAFNTSTAFSPTDTPILSLRLKWLSMAQSSLSLVILATLAARAINIL